MHILKAQIQNMALREDTLDGKPHIVFPVVLMVEGVHTGLSGVAYYYPADELEHSVPYWNGVPVPVHHPTTPDGEPLSVNNPQILTERNVGRLFNVYFEESKLKGEIWIDPEQAERVSPGLITDLRGDTTMEVSTGLYFDETEPGGTWNGEEYQAIATNYVPDHLALLPGAVGACSWGDGCGVRANKKDESMLENIRSAARTPDFSGTESTSWGGVSTGFGAYRDAYYKSHGGKPDEPAGSVKNAPSAMKNWIASKTLLGDGAAENERDLIFFPVVNPNTNKLNEGALRAVISGRGSQANIPAAAKKSAQTKARNLLNKHFGAELEADERPGLFRRVITMVANEIGLTVSETSHNDLRDDLQKAISEAMAPTWRVWIRDVYDDFVIYEAAPGNGPFDVGGVEKLFRRTYSKSEDGTLTIGNDVIEVKERREYVPVTNESNTTDLEPDESPQEDNMRKDELVTGLIANEATKFTDDDKEWLMALEETQLAKLCPCPNEDPKEPPEDPKPAEEAPKDDPPAEPEPKDEPMSLEEYVSKAPPEVRETLQRAVADNKAKKDALIKALVENKDCKFTKEELQTRCIDDLEKLSALAKVNVDYSGKVGGPSVNDDAVPPMPPVFDLTRKSA